MNPEKKLCLSLELGSPTKIYHALNKYRWETVSKFIPPCVKNGTFLSWMPRFFLDLMIYCIGL